MPRDVAEISMQLLTQNRDGGVRRAAGTPLDALPEHVRRRIQPHAMKRHAKIRGNAFDALAAIRAVKDRIDDC